MGRMMVDFGIDLGVTNSAIAVLHESEVEVVKNNEGFEYTPSSVFIDKNDAVVVGRRAKERLVTDSQNAYAEFKLQMGTNAECVFARSGRRMKPEELSAEVLKSLKDNVKQRFGEEVNAAVITVPAAFDLPQCMATRAAAQLAGITFSPLVQEPIAAAMGYGFHRNQGEKVFWLAYDLGGGTFDAAVMQVSEGVIQVINHGGDNHIGGKLIDWAIVEQLLIPALTRERRLTDFRRGNPKWGKAIAKLKMAAEQSKICASREQTTEIVIDSLCLDDNGDPVDFEYELCKSDVERMAEPFILRSINICRKVLSERKLAVGYVEKIILVGGPTLMPYLRECLADPKEGLGIPIDISVDPLRVKVCGAAVYAGMTPNDLVLSVNIKPTHTIGYKSIRPLDVFLCHSSSDKQAVRNLYERLSADGVSPWLDEKDLLPGQKWEQEIPRAVRHSDAVIICLSQSAINKRGYVQKEIKYALDVADEHPENAIFLIPIKLEECQIPERLRSLHCVGLFKENGYELLMRSLGLRAIQLGLTEVRAH